MKYLIILALFLSGTIVSAQDLSKKKLSATVDHQYKSMKSPIRIVYKVYPYGGSGNYEFRWREKGGSFSDYSSVSIYERSFDCEIERTPRVKLICQVRDKESGKTLTIQKTHAVEFCLN